MTDNPPYNLPGLDAYRDYCLKLASERLSGYRSIKDVEAALDDMNAYPNLAELEEPVAVTVFDESQISSNDLDRARRTVVEGGLFCEHTAAGEATRLKLGTKFLINPAFDLSAEKIRLLLTGELGREVEIKEVKSSLDAEPENLLQLSLGSRHMLQMAFDVHNLAAEYGIDPEIALKRQKMLVVLNEKTSDRILEEFMEANFFGFKPQNVLFMVQASFNGINMDAGRFFFDDSLPSRLHNHGQLVMQETMDGQIFYLNDSGKRVYLASQEFQSVLSDAEDKISYNIEDLGYLGEAVDFGSLALTLQLGDQGNNMVMEIVANNPERPQKGGLAAFDPMLKKNVMIESFQLKGVENKDIKYLNKNFNHFPKPEKSWLMLKNQGLPMPLAVKGQGIYFQPVQGDINFLVKTAFVRRKVLKPIQAWKSASTISPAVNAMFKQDNQQGFKLFVDKVLGRPV